MPKTLKLLSYNVNGIRAAIKKGLDGWIAEQNYDIICLQETKAHQEQVDMEWAKKLGYEDHWFSAEKKGYSSVATLTKMKPLEVIKGMGHELYDSEGRSILLDYGDFAVLNVYIPSGSSGDERQAIKMEFLDFFFDYLMELKKKYPKLMVCGDYNICNKAIDIHNPKSNKNSSGFTPEERAWMDKLFENGFIDSFRHFNQEPDHYTWWSFRANARNNNKGWRIDYFAVSDELKDQLKGASILPEVKHSDHCPIDIKIVEAN